MAQAPLGVRPLELQGGKKLEEYSAESADPCRQVPATAGALAGLTLADGVGLGHSDPVAGSTKHLQGGRHHIPKAGGEGT